MTDSVKIVEVGPRDGLQNEKSVVSTEVKIELINRLSAAGLANIEATSFVSPKWVPQLADAAEVMERITRRPGVTYSVLAPNLQGAKNALAAKADEVVIFTAASETFCLKNINCTIDQSFDRYAAVADAVKANGVRLRGSISCSFGCPFEGDVPISSVINVVRRLRALGCDEIDLADTIGVGTVKRVRALVPAASGEFPIERLAGHYHDTYGQALANILASLEAGLSTFHSSVAGLGGCPYAPGATGNVATEDLLYLLHGLSLRTDIKLEDVVTIGDFISNAIHRPNFSKAGSAFLAKTRSANTPESCR
ncbi:MAG: hydroxymethylglutaryl-CoA lyase [Verrucomicrobia bacterium]|nr:hydroxymethylglutaryl-CoA lyase [Verrucomicrobiota bacterium]MBV8484391.1 hydroxymethylglutaryl-CoA lyase [Verrucomicrobiota bacterium]